MADGERRDPFVGFNFRMEIDGVEVAGFREITGLRMRTEIVEYFDGDDVNTTVKKIPGITTYNNIVCKRGISAGIDLYEWCKEVNDQSRAVERKTITINFLDDAGEPQKTYTLYEAWPCAYSVSDFNAANNQLGMEEIEFVIELFEVED